MELGRITHVVFVVITVTAMACGESKTLPLQQRSNTSPTPVVNVQATVAAAVQSTMEASLEAAQSHTPTLVPSPTPSSPPETAATVIARPTVANSTSNPPIDLPSLVATAVQGFVGRPRSPTPVVASVPKQTTTPTPRPTTTSSPSPLPTTAVNAFRQSVFDLIDRPPPIASLISISKPASDGITEVKGEPGAVPGLTDVMVATVEYANAVFVRSALNGSFAATIKSAPGATIQVRYNPYGPIPRNDGAHQKNHWPGTLIRVPDKTYSGSGFPFSAAGSASSGEGQALWSLSGSVDNRESRPGKRTSVSGTLTMYVPEGLDTPDRIKLFLLFGMDILFDDRGRQSTSSSIFISNLLTPSGMPIERARGPLSTNIEERSVILEKRGQNLAVEFDLEVRIPSDIPPGTYRLYAWIPDGPELDSVAGRPINRDLAVPPTNLLGYRAATVSILTIGSPRRPKLSPAILIDSPSQGARGVIALEDKGNYQW